MNQRPLIGSEYDGPSFDRPCLRRLPPHWELDLPQPTFRDLLRQWLADALAAFVYRKLH